MCQVSDRSEPNSRSSGTSQSTGSGDGAEKFASIKAANRKIRLLDVLRHYGFRIEKNPQRPTWSNNFTCPFPSHKGSKERTASFGYCFVSDHFCCLGCNKSGRAVEFISLYEQLPRAVVADRILAQYGEDVSIDEFQEFQDDITPVLLEGSKYLQTLIQKHKHNPQMLAKIDKLIWWLDFYLMAKSPGNKINPKELEYRISKIKELLS